MASRGVARVSSLGRSASGSMLPEKAGRGTEAKRAPWAREVRRKGPCGHPIMRLSTVGASDKAVALTEGRLTGSVPVVASPDEGGGGVLAMLVVVVVATPRGGAGRRYARWCLYGGGGSRHAAPSRPGDRRCRRSDVPDTVAVSHPASQLARVGQRGIPGEDGLSLANIGSPSAIGAAFLGRCVFLITLQLSVLLLSPLRCLIQRGGAIKGKERGGMRWSCVGALLSSHHRLLCTPSWNLQAVRSAFPLPDTRTRPCQGTGTQQRRCWAVAPSFIGATCREG